MEIHGRIAADGRSLDQSCSPPAKSQLRGTITSSSSGGEGISLQAHSFSIEFQMVGNRGNQYAKQDSPTALNRLSHVAGVFDGREIRLYIDGRRQQKSDVLELPFKPPTGGESDSDCAGSKEEELLRRHMIGEVRIYEGGTLHGRLHTASPL